MLWGSQQMMLPRYRQESWKGWPWCALDWKTRVQINIETKDWVENRSSTCKSTINKPSFQGNGSTGTHFEWTTLKECTYCEWTTLKECSYNGFGQPGGQGSMLPSTTWSFSFLLCTPAYGREAGMERMQQIKKKHDHSEACTISFSPQTCCILWLKISTHIKFSLATV